MADGVDWAEIESVATPWVVLTTRCATCHKFADRFSILAVEPYALDPETIAQQGNWERVEATRAGRTCICSTVDHLDTTALIRHVRRALKCRAIDVSVGLRVDLRAQK